MRRPLFIILSLLLIGQLAIAQNNPHSNDSAPYIEVNGNAEKWVVPDEIYISITLRERESGKDQISIEQQENQLKEALRSINVPIENLSMSDAFADYIQVKWSKKDVISQNEYELKVSTAQQVKDVFEKLDELKIDNAFISRTDHSKIIEYRKEVRINAITAAKEKADYLLEAIGQKTGMALVVNERTMNPMAPSMANSLELQPIYFNLEQSASKKAEITFSKIKLESNIYVKFGIE